MSLRTKLNDHPVMVGAAVVALTAVAIWFAYSTTTSTRPSVLPMFLSTDDGATWFESMTGELPPIKQADGKVAVRVYLFKCGEDGEPFVGYLEKYSDEAKALLDQANSNKGKANMADLPKLQAATVRGKLVKRPSDKNWTAAGGDITAVTCPDKSKATLVQYQ